MERNDIGETIIHKGETTQEGTIWEGIIPHKGRTIQKKDYIRINYIGKNYTGKNCTKKRLYYIKKRLHGEEII